MDEKLDGLLRGFDRLEASMTTGFAEVNGRIDKLALDVAGVKSELSEVKDRLDTVSASVSMMEPLVVAMARKVLGQSAPTGGGPSPSAIPLAAKPK